VTSGASTSATGRRCRSRYGSGYPGFLFGSTTPCNGVFTTDAAMANIEEASAARLEVSLDSGVQAATVVLRPAPADSHL
jgi:hypothetical protein